MDKNRICALSGIDVSRLVLLEETSSTNDVAKNLAREGAAHGAAVLALRQSAGRGRLGRSFLSPEGGVYLSVILRPDFTAEELLPLTALLAACAVQAVEESAHIRPQIKWVNDLVLEDKKLAGILTEPAFRGDGTLEFVVCGIGLNCNTAPEAFSDELRSIATSLQTVTGQAQDAEALVAALVKHLPRACLREEKVHLLQFCRENCITLGKTVKVMAEKPYLAVAEELDDTAALLVRDAQGMRHRIYAGEVSVRGLYGYVDC